MNKPLTLGSLFDGSGGFPLAGLLTGIVPVWSSEIEPFAIRVTEKRLAISAVCMVQSCHLWTSSPLAVHARI